MELGMLEGPLWTLKGLLDRQREQGMLEGPLWTLKGLLDRQM